MSVMVRCLKLTPALRTQLARVERAAALYPNDDDGIEPLEREQLALGLLVVAAVSEQAAAQQIRIARLPARAPMAVVDVQLTPKRRRHHG